MRETGTLQQKQSDYIHVGLSANAIRVHRELVACVEKDILPGTGVGVPQFWGLMQAVLGRFREENDDLLRFRAELQSKIDEWYKSGSPGDQVRFLREIGYLPTKRSCSSTRISPTNIDPEISRVSSPQLVVPVDNDRFVVNAVNSRWGSLFSAVSSSDVLGRNPLRVDVHSFVCSFLDSALPLMGGPSHWKDVQRLFVSRTGAQVEYSLVIELANGSVTGLRDSSLWVGWSLDSIFCLHNGLHVWLKTNPGGNGIEDVVLESALTAILDLEDSVATVDAEDKSKAYRNWARVMKGEMEYKQPGEGPSKKLQDDIVYRSPRGKRVVVPGRVVALVRNVGIHCKTDIILDDRIRGPAEFSSSSSVYEGLVDAVITIVAGLRDLRSSHRNSRAGSIYIVKPKLHGPREVEFACKVFSFIEHYLSIPFNTVKIGIMDEERRTSATLRECISVAKERVFFINTGFLDRTGDEIHTCMRGGPVVPKSRMKSCPWIKAYEQLNVIAGIESGFIGKAQIGKGMWAEPDSMKAMVGEKIVHARAGASTAWVPSPTAATLHALHYHQVDVKAVQSAMGVISPELMDKLMADLLTPPLMTKKDIAESLKAEEIQSELENNAHGILGYVVRWVDMGIGCSKVPDMRNVGLMEDLATLRISSQHITNWLLHGLVSEQQVDAAFLEMAKKVDEQNRKDPRYRPMSGDAKNNTAFQTALRLVKEGTKLSSGYSIEFLVEARKRIKKLQRDGSRDAIVSPTSKL